MTHRADTPPALWPPPNMGLCRSRIGLVLCTRTDEVSMAASTAPSFKAVRRGIMTRTVENAIAQRCHAVWATRLTLTWEMIFQAKIRDQLSLRVLVAAG